MRTGEIKRQRPPVWPVPGKTPKTPHMETGAARHPLWRWVKRLALALLIGVIVLVITSGLVFWRLTVTVTNYTGAHFNQHQNAVWLEHEWAGQSHTSGDYDALAQRLSAEQVTYVFAHVGPLNSDGTIPDDLAPNAATLVSELHVRLPNLHVLAWIGQVEAAGGNPGDVTVDLGNSAVRAQIAQTAAHFVKDLGFDGVHYDIEPIINNNPRFIDLLTETRALLPPGAILSTIGQKWAPNAHMADFLRSQGKGGAWWTSYYYADVAAHVDQIVPIIYDTAMPTARTYEIFVQQETEHILESVRSASHPPQVLIGVPTYAGNSFWFHDSAENVSTSLSGVIAGLNSNSDTSAFTGVALYRFATTTDADWSVYDTMWLGK